jgi:CheY-like chemotaxis protein
VEEPQPEGHDRPRRSRIGLDAFDLEDPATREALAAALLDGHRMGLVSRLAPGIAHDLKNPLTSIVAFAHLARTNDDLPADVRQDADLVAQEAERTRRLLAAFIDFARSRPPERQPTRLDVLLDAVRELVAYELQGATATLRVDLPRPAPIVIVDRGELVQALVTLVAAAIDGIARSRRRGAIAINAKDARPGFVSMQLSTPVAVPLAEDPLALPAVMAIAEAHGGALVDESTDEHFAIAIELPAAQPRDTATTTDATASAAAGVVLVVDDQPVIRSFLGKALAHSGRAMRAVASGTEATDAAADTSIGLVICDQRLADMTGIDVYRAVVAMRPDLAGRFALMTGDPDADDVTIFAESEGIPVLAKPFDLATIDRLLTRFHLDE